ncbi:hypothetical protein [Flavobacterium sp.]|uniref:hypothetical protein n=1 Tax=Flavobacterium sp. TaxID=239 RepID=UPI00286E345C|nr:hypothetical protein [Flavobacterium sp.]
MKTIILKLLIIIPFFLIISCDKPKDKLEQKNEYWDEIQLITRNQKIIIYNENDTASFENEIFKKVSGNYSSAIYKFEKIDKKSFSLNRNERDSLYKYTKAIITKPVFTDRASTDYAGYVLIKLRDRHTTLMCEYKSVGEWSTVSEETKNIYNLLKTKIDVAKQ